MAIRATALTTAAAATVFTLLCNVSADANANEQRRACERDAFTFCSSEIPDVDRITICMVRNLKKLSPRCRAQFRQPASTAERSWTPHDAP